MAVQPGQAQPPCPSGCCMGNELLCISIPCPVQIVLLGGALNLELQIPCIKLTSTSTLTGAQANQLLTALQSLIGGLAGAVSGAEA